MQVRSWDLFTCLSVMSVQVVEECVMRLIWWYCVYSGCWGVWARGCARERANWVHCYILGVSVRLSRSRYLKHMMHIFAIEEGEHGEVRGEAWDSDRWQSSCYAEFLLHWERKWLGLYIRRWRVVWWRVWESLGQPGSICEKEVWRP